MKNHGVLAAAALALFLTASCTHPTQPITGHPDAIEYKSFGGFGGGIFTHLTVQSDGVAILHSVQPELQQRLGTAQMDTIFSLFLSYDAWKNENESTCTDDIFYTFRVTRGSQTKEISAAGCSLEHSQSELNTQRIVAAIAYFESLALSIYEQEAQWIGLKAETRIDKDLYGLNEPIVISCQITNPTAKQRTLFFPHAEQLWFGCDKMNFPSFNYMFPPRFSNDTSSATQIVLQPGEQKVVVHIWDQTMTDANGKTTTLGVGYYDLHMGLIAGNLPNQEGWFEVVDKSIPLGGMIIPDVAGESSESLTYTFALAVRNWTQNTLTLHFPGSQRLYIRLWDLGGLSPPDSAIYEGPTGTDSLVSQVTFEPGEIKTFQYTVEKSKIGPWYMWTYAKISLLCSDFAFSRDGQLQFFRKP